MSFLQRCLVRGGCRTSSLRILLNQPSTLQCRLFSSVSTGRIRSVLSEEELPDAQAEVEAELEADAEMLNQDEKNGMRKYQSMRTQVTVDHNREYLKMIRQNSTKEIADRIESIVSRERYVQYLFDTLKDRNDDKTGHTIEWDPGLTLQDLSYLKQQKSNAEDSTNIGMFGNVLSGGKYSFRRQQQNLRFFGGTEEVTFDTLGIDPQLTSAIESLGVTRASHIQRLAIPQLIGASQNAVIASETGTGKTLSYLIPILQNLLSGVWHRQRNDEYLQHISRDLGYFSGDLGIEESERTRELIQSFIQDVKEKKEYGITNFGVWAEKKFPSVVILQPSLHLVKQCEVVLNQLLKAYYAQVFSDRKSELIREWRIKEVNNLSTKQKRALADRYRSNPNQFGHGSVAKIKIGRGSYEYVLLDTEKRVPPAVEQKIERQIESELDNPISVTSLLGKSLLPSVSSMMGDIVVCTPHSLLANIHKKNSEQRMYSFLSKIRCVVIDEADMQLSSQSRTAIKYLFSNLSDLREKIEERPVKAVELIPYNLRRHLNADSSRVYRELQWVGKPQVIFAGATIPIHKQARTDRHHRQSLRTVAEYVKEWLTNAVWIRTPGLHEPIPTVEQEFRFVPLGSNRRTLTILLNEAAKEHWERRVKEKQIHKNMVLDLSQGDHTAEKVESDNDMNDDNDSDIDQESDEFDLDESEQQRRESLSNNNTSQIYSLLPRRSAGMREDVLKVLVFCNNQPEVQVLEKHLSYHGFCNVWGITSTIDRNEQIRRVGCFMRGSNPDSRSTTTKEKRGVFILIGTDSIARGIDFRNVDLVVNHEFPLHAVSYLHRAGRVCRGAAQVDMDDSQVSGENDVPALVSTTNQSGKVISLFSECDLDLVWHLQMALLNHYELILRDELGSTNQESDVISDSSSIGSLEVRTKDLLTGAREMQSRMRDVQAETGRRRMSAPRLHENRVDLSRIDFSQCDPALIEVLAQNMKIPARAIARLKRRQQRIQQDGQGSDSSDGSAELSDEAVLKVLSSEGGVGSVESDSPVTEEDAIIDALRELGEKKARGEKDGSSGSKRRLKQRRQLSTKDRIARIRGETDSLERSQRVDAVDDVTGEDDGFDDDDDDSGVRSSRRSRSKHSKSEPSLRSLLDTLPKSQKSEKNWQLTEGLEDMIASGKVSPKAWKVPFTPLQLDYHSQNNSEEEEEEN